jgi:hypothetical protein
MKGACVVHTYDFLVQQLHMGYFMLFFAMMSIMFTKHSRFADLRRKLEKDKDKIKTDLRLLLSFLMVLQTHNHEHDAAGSHEPCGKRKPRGVGPTENK